MRSQLTSQLAMQTDWINNNTDENGNFNPSNDVSQGSTTPNFDQTVGEAIDSIEDSIEDLSNELN